MAPDKREHLVLVQYRPLKDIFKTSKIGGAERRLCIPSFDGFTEVNVFKTPHHRDYKMDWKEDMVTVAMATAAAPTYFPVYKKRSTHVRRRRGLGK